MSDLIDIIAILGIPTICVGTLFVILNPIGFWQKLASLLVLPLIWVTVAQIIIKITE